MNVKLIEVADFEELSSAAAAIVEQQVLSNSHFVLGLATGSTPIGLYEKMAEGFRQRGVSYRHVQTINLDEYRGLGDGHPNSYRSFMNEHLFKAIDIPHANTHIPDGRAVDVEAECRRYEALIDRIGPPDLQILGLGTNGHIGFNEPGTPEGSLTHCVALTDSTRENNARFFASPEEVPTHAITMGIASILKSRKILLLASGAKKAPAVMQFMERRITDSFPASFLWKHPDVTLIVDEEAYQLVREKRQ
ncbi:glucosamine-6-phosphate deaminase [Planococcus sp. FY231025]|uniref:glucosamine-6-phosphate deaminase n=1 Tax=Planococcus sp. FY231025 TaxID=3455699 RepID=UPI003F8F55F0